MSGWKRDYDMTMYKISTKIRDNCEDGTWIEKDLWFYLFVTYCMPIDLNWMIHSDKHCSKLTVSCCSRKPQKRNTHLGRWAVRQLLMTAAWVPQLEWNMSRSTKSSSGRSAHKSWFQWNAVCSSREDLLFELFCTQCTQMISEQELWSLEMNF